MHIDGVEWCFAGELDAEHNHPRHPEEEDVVARLHDRRRVEAVELLEARLVLCWPADGCKRPQPRREPRVEDVIILAKGHARAEGRLRLRVRVGLRARDKVARLAKIVLVLVGIPNRDTMPPPELARDAPVLDVLEPIEVNLLEALGDDLDLAVAHGVAPLGGHPVHLDEPLAREHRLDDLAAAL